MNVHGPEPPGHQHVDPKPPAAVGNEGNGYLSAPIAPVFGDRFRIASSSPHP